LANKHGDKRAGISSKRNTINAISKAAFQEVTEAGHNIPHSLVEENLMLPYFSESGVKPYTTLH
jgi:hypothetical protein